MKQFARRALDVIGFAISVVQVWWFRRRHRGTVTVLDIDNTLADAWPSFLGDHADERNRLAGLAILPGMKAAAYDPPIASGAGVLFLSHRNWWEWPLTRTWLRDQGLAGPLVLVSTPADKLTHLRRIVSGGGPVVYWDDLSHGTEHGTTELYDDVIDAVRELGLEYHDHAEIEAIVDGAGGRAHLV